MLFSFSPSLSARPGVRRTLLPVLAAAVVLIAPSASSLAQPLQPVPAPIPVPKPASSLPDVPLEQRHWAVNLDAARLFAAPGDDAEPLGTIRQFTYLEILGYEGEWAQVYNPRTRITAFLRSDELGPSDAPPAYIAADPPPTVEEVNVPGRIVSNAWLYLYPTPDEGAQTAQLGHNTPIHIVDTVDGDDGETWYRTAEGDYLPTASVRLPRPAPRTFSGRWIDTDLQEPVMLTAYEDDRPVLTTLAIKGAGRWATPTGVFSIQRRVANETMSSDTIGIPRTAPGGYHLTNVLYTQYFLGSGESLHYNYWSSNFGYAGSHGCLGLTLADSEFLWNWASIGTPVSIHY